MTNATPKLTDLLGIPHEEANCWAIARRVLDRYGVPTPESPASALLNETAFAMPIPLSDVRAADVLIMQGPEPDFGLHIAVAIDERRMIHTMSGGASCIDRIEVWRRAGKIQRAARPVLRTVEHSGDRGRWGS